MKKVIAEFVLFAIVLAVAEVAEGGTARLVRSYISDGQRVCVYDNGVSFPIPEQGRCPQFIETV